MSKRHPPLLPSTPPTPTLLGDARGAAGGEYLSVLATLAVVGAGGFAALGGAMSSSIAGDAHGAATFASGASLTVQAAERPRGEVIDELLEKGLEDEDIQFLEDIGIELEHIDDYTREDLTALGVNPGVIEKIKGMDPDSLEPDNQNNGNGGNNGGGGNGNGNNGGGGPTLGDDEVIDPNSLDPDAIAEELGVEHTLDELDPNASRFKECIGIADERARSVCFAETAGIEPPPSYVDDLGENGFFSLDYWRGAWHDFSNAVGRQVKNFWEFVKNPGKAFSSLLYAIHPSHIGDTASNIKNFYTDEWRKGGWNFAGVITGDVLTTLGPAVGGRVLHAGKFSLVRRFPGLGKMRGFRLAGRRLEYGPFTGETFKEGSLQSKGIFVKSNGKFKLEGAGKRLKARAITRNYLNGNGRFGSRRANARRLLTEDVDVAQFLAHQERLGRSTLHAGLFKKSDLLTNGELHHLSKLDDASRATAKSALDGYVNKQPMTRADRVLRDAARNADGSFSLSDKVTAVKVSKDGFIELQLRASDRVQSTLGTYRGGGMQVNRAKFKNGADAVIVRLPQEFFSPTSGKPFGTALLDSVLMGLPASLATQARHNPRPETATVPVGP